MSQHNLNQRWAVILAGGDGNRLKTLTRAIAGDDRPKQFCPELARRPDDLSVFRLSNVGWTDLREPIRVASTFQSNQFRERRPSLEIC